jgi:hypothetical protein
MSKKDIGCQFFCALQKFPFTSNELSDGEVGLDKQGDRLQHATRNQ